MKNKNIWLLPTDKESRLHFDDKLFLSTSLQISKNINSIVEGRNIYITSEKEIKMGDWYTIEFNGIPITKCISEEELISIEGRNDCKKIILTTDDQLIKDGVQEIDDEFLEWFVKNPSCERVEVEKGFPDGTSYGYNFIDYKIIIPKEEVLLQSSIDGESIWGEAKQETLEEVAEILHHDNGFEDDLYCDEGKILREAWLEGAKWQQERSYSEEEVLNLLLNLPNYPIDTYREQRINQWFEQFKNK